MNINITFSDKADSSILNHSSQIPRNGKYRPAENLDSHFGRDPVNGYWMLTIFDGVIDEQIGTLLEWNMNLKVDYCSEGISWTKLSVNSNSCQEATISNGTLIKGDCYHCGRHPTMEEQFTPLHSHTSIAVGNDVFVVGGYNLGVKSEIWRFTYSTRKWVQLHDSLSRPNTIGQVASLTPLGMVTIGGMRTGLVDSPFQTEIILYDVLERTQERLQVEFK